MATQSITLGRHLRLYVADTDTPANDSDYIAVVNENSIEITQTADNEQIDTKSNGGEKVTLPGVKQYTLSVTIDYIYTDAGLDIMEEKLNTVWSYQIRDERTDPNKVYVEGNWTITEMKETAGAKGAKQLVVTLQGSGNVTFSRPTRALVLS